MESFCTCESTVSLLQLAGRRDYCKTLKATRGFSLVSWIKIINFPLIADEKSQKLLWMKGEKKSKSFILYDYYYFPQFTLSREKYSIPLNSFPRNEKKITTIFTLIWMILIYFASRRPHFHSSKWNFHQLFEHFMKNYRLRIHFNLEYLLSNPVRCSSKRFLLKKQAPVVAWL